MSDIEFINIHSRRNHICNFPKQTLQHPLAICRALLFISQQLRHFSQTKHWSPHTFGHIVHTVFPLYYFPSVSDRDGCAWLPWHYLDGLTDRALPQPRLVEL